MTATGLGLFIAAVSVGIVVYFRYGCIAIAIATFGATTGAYIAWHGLRTLITSFVPTPVIEVSATTLRAGERLQVFVRQPGPAAFEKYVVELICVQQRRTSWHETVRRYGRDRMHEYTVQHSEYNTYVLASAALVTEENMTVARSQPLERTVACTVPMEGEPTGGSEARMIWWLIRVEVVPRRLPSFVVELPVVVS